MRGWRGTDEDLSIVYQLRRDSYTGPIIKEACVQPTRDDWQPAEGAPPCAKLHGQPQAFGVPKGATIAGKTPVHANVFVLKWRCNARYRNPATGLLSRTAPG